MSKAKPEPRMSGPRRPAARAASIASAIARLGQRVLAADVEEAAARAGRERRDRHRLDDRERVALHEDAVLERAGLRLVGVADEVVRLGRLRRDGRPLAPGRERGAAAAHELERGDLGDDRLAARSRGRARGRVAAVRAVVVERRRVDDADPSAGAAGRRPPCWRGSAGRPASRRPSALGPGASRVDDRRRRRPGAADVVAASVAGDRDQRRRRALAEARGTASGARSPAVARRLPAGPERSARGRRRAPPRRRAGRRCRRRRGRRPAAAASSRRARRTWRRRRPRPAAPSGAGRCS